MTEQAPEQQKKEKFTFGRDHEHAGVAYTAKQTESFTPDEIRWLKQHKADQPKPKP